MNGLARIAASAPRRAAGAPLAELVTRGTPELGAVRYVSPAARDALRLALERQGTRLIGVRHGQSEANARGHAGGAVLLCGASESPLSAMGRAQAQEAAARLFSALGGATWLAGAAHDSERLPVIVASPLSRARHTAEAFVGRLHRELDGLVAGGVLSSAAAAAAKRRVAVAVDPRLREMSFGALELSTLEAARRAQPHLIGTWDSFTGPGVNFTGRFPAGESRLDVMTRVAGFLADVERLHARRTVVSFSHLETLVGLSACLGLSTASPCGDLRANGAGFANATPITLCGR